MQRILLDSSIYVSLLRDGNGRVEIERLASDADVWLSAVVLEELYAGAKERDRSVLETIGRGRLTNDALIALSAARASIRVLTLHEKDFRKLAEFRPFEWRVVAS